MEAAAVGYLFVDMNAYFASVEQQFRPELRGRPVAVAAVQADSTCCIAVSYEAKPYGIRTGTGVGEAKRRCPDIRIIEARPEVYVRVHHQIIAAVETVLPVEKVCSIDEMACRLLGREREPQRAVALGRQVKRAIAERVGEHLRCSVGVAPNRFLAKVASDLQKPDGLTLITPADLPQRLYALGLTDLPGIGRRMRNRLWSHRVMSVEQLCALSKAQMRAIWGSVVGEYYWHWLRGHEPPQPATRRTTIGHSHVLPPELRTQEGARAVLVKLIHKAAMRLRRSGYWAGRLSVYVSFGRDESGWEGAVALGQCQDTRTMLQAFDVLWPLRPPGRITQVAATLSELTAPHSAAEPLFPQGRADLHLARVMDRINVRFGGRGIYPASMLAAEKEDAAPMRIAFNHIPDIDGAIR